MTLTRRGGGGGVDKLKVNRFFEKQCRPRWNATERGISPGSTLFAIVKTFIGVLFCFYSKNPTCEPLRYSMNSSKLIVPNQMEEPINQ